MENMKEVVSKNFSELMDANPQHSQREIARHIKVNENSISRWKKGLNAPEMDNIEKLADFFGVPWQRFFHVKSTSKVDVEPLSIFASRLLNVPDRVWELATELGDSKNEAWAEIIGTLEDEIEQRKLRVQAEGQSKKA